MSDSVQNAMPGSATVAFLGPLGTFTHAAVDQHFGTEVNKHSMTTINDVFAEVESGRASYGVVPVENSTEGAVNNTQDCLIDTSLQIIAEVVIPIAQNFMLQKGGDPTQITRIVSHRQSLAQCRRWLSVHWPNTLVEEVSSNAEAARQASADPHTAAIAGERAASLYGLTLVHKGIQDQQSNCTRFLVLAPKGVAPTGNDKCSILVYTENKPGALFRILEPFNTFQVSLTKIETRPAPDSVWAYVFFIDFEGHIEDQAVQHVIEQLRERTVKIKQLGSYPMVQVMA
ncbi:MAG: prephenate dehydratase [Gammaproteobacteria bacterium]